MLDNQVLIVSSPGTEGGAAGIFALGRDALPELVDPIPTTGMALSPDGTRLARLTWPEGDVGRSDLIISDRTGLLLYRRIDDLEEPHSLLWLEDGLVAVSTMTNSVLWMDDSGRVVDTWSPPDTGPGDCWHLNSLYFDGETLFVSAFGQFGSHRAWAEPGARAGAGIIFNLSTKTVVVGGLDGPHNPVPVDGDWLVCNSGTQDVRRVSPDGEVLLTTPLGGWTRGLLVVGSEVIVGVGAHRFAPVGVQARLVVLDRVTLEEIRSLPLPGREVFEVLAVPPALVEGLRVGAATAVFRTLGSPEVRMSAPGDPQTCALQVTVTSVQGSEASVDAVNVAVRLTNTGKRAVSGIGPFPVRVGARRVLADGALVDEATRGELSYPLSPGASCEATLTVSVHQADVAVRIAGVQEGARWLDDVTASAAVELPMAHILAAVGGRT